MALSDQPLDEEDQASIIIDARSGDLTGLKEIFTQFIHPKLLITCRDPVTNSTPLHMAAANNHTETIRYMFSLIQPPELKAWVNAQNNAGNTALHWATLNGHLTVIKLLCDEYEADPFIKNNFGHDAIYEAENKALGDIETYYLKKYNIEPTQDSDISLDNPETTTTADIQISEGTETEQITKEGISTEKTFQLE